MLLNCEIDNEASKCLTQLPVGRRLIGEISPKSADQR